jgi:membrane-bound lytic murein transglycosylase B
LKALFPFFRYSLVIAAGLGLFLAGAGATAKAQANAEKVGPKPFERLQERLVTDRFDPELVSRIFDHEAIEFDIKGISAYFRHREATLDYDQFLSPKSLQSAREYMDAHERMLSKTENAYGVDKTVITAIILVETRLGRYTGNRSVVNTLATMAAMEEPAVREYFWENLPPDVSISRERFEQKARQKSDWAYRELKAFIEHVEKEDLRPHDIIGSYAGALGIAQFMPSNILVYAKDGNGDGRINLFDHGDAIASIANYLKRHGWQEDMSREEAGKVVYRYNHSKYYVNTILQIADRLKG